MATQAQTAYQKARAVENKVEQLVLKHLPLVRRIVNHLPWSLLSVVCEEDLVSAGALGLVEAAHRFDESKGVKFETFAYRRVRGAIMDYLRETDCLGKSARWQLTALKRHIREFRSASGRMPSVEQLAEIAKMPEEQVLKYLSYEKWDYVASLDSTREDSDGEPNVLKMLAADTAEAPPAELERKERVEQLSRAIQELPERQKQIIVKYYYAGVCMAEMAEILNISKSRVSQLHTLALYDLSGKLEEG